MHQTWKQLYVSWKVCKHATITSNKTILVVQIIVVALQRKFFTAIITYDESSKRGKIPYGENSIWQNFLRREFEIICISSQEVFLRSIFLKEWYFVHHMWYPYIWLKLQIKRKVTPEKLTFPKRVVFKEQFFYMLGHITKKRLVYACVCMREYVFILLHKKWYSLGRTIFFKHWLESFIKFQNLIVYTHLSDIICKLLFKLIWFEKKNDIL